MQEYLAAFHVSILSSDMQLQLMRNTFCDGQFNFMWIMYVGIVGVKSYTFVYFIGESHSTWNNIYDDKRKCLHLFQCYMEAKSDAEMPKTISTIFTDGNITLNCITLLPHHILSLMYFMSSSSLYQWKILALNSSSR